MSSPYYQRKWAGAPHSELKKEAPPEPSKLSKRKPGGSPRPIIKKASQWNMLRDERTKKPFRWYWWEKAWFCPYVGVNIHGYMGSCLDHVVKRLRGMLVEDTAVKVYYIVAQHDGQQISPEFSSYENLQRWLVYEGLANGWLMLVRSQGWKTEEWYHRLEIK